MIKINIMELSNLYFHSSSISYLFSLVSFLSKVTLGPLLFLLTFITHWVSYFFLHTQVESNQQPSSIH